MSHERLKPTFTIDSDKIEELKRIVPEVFADGKINLQALGINYRQITQDIPFWWKGGIQK